MLNCVLNNDYEMANNNNVNTRTINIASMSIALSSHSNVAPMMAPAEQP